MSFLRKMFGGGVTTSGPRRFVVEAMLGAMEADGDVTDEEIEALQKNLDEHDLFSDLSQDARARLIDMAADAIREAKSGTARIGAMAKGLPSRGHRLAAYAMACQVCVSDADLPESEIRYLEALQTGFAISTGVARDIFEAARKSSGLKSFEERAEAMRDLLPRFVDCMALTAASDGEVHPDEVAGVRAVLLNIPDMRVLTGDELDEAIEVAFERVNDKDPTKELENIAKAITEPADRYWTTVYMMIVALADGKTDWREVGFLKSAQSIMELSDTQMDEAMATAALFPAAPLGGKAPT